MPTDRYRTYDFLVEVDSLIVGGFSEVSGIGMTVQTEDVKEGGENTFTHKLPTGIEYPNLVLRRGLADTALWDWIEDVVGSLQLMPTLELKNLPLVPSGDRKNVRVILKGMDGTEQWGWQFKQAYPVQWTGPEFDATQSAVAMESLELVHRGLSRIDGLP